MATLGYFKVFLWPRKGWHLQWRFEDLPNNHTIDIERASGPEGPWEVIDTVGAQSITYDDQSVPRRSLFTILWYRLKVRDGNGDVVLTSKPITNEKQADKFTAEIIRQYEIRLQGSDVHPGYYARFFACYKRAVDGKTCDCVDEVTGDRKRDRCPLCLGTGYLESWSNPVTFRGAFMDGETRTTNIRNLTEEESLTRQMWTANYPVLEPGDVLVEKDNERHWKVDTISVSNPNDVMVSQRAQIELMDHEYIENQLTYPS